MKTKPDFAFTLPSLFDGIPIDCRIYIPKQAFRQDHSALKGAIFAHPYAPLGGSYDDFVVLVVTKCLLERGFLVATFNFR
jgi:alpha/beta superfamily hydrolase